MNKTWNSCTKALCIICFLYSSALFFGCSSKELPPSEVIEIETIEILDLGSDKKSPLPSAAEQEAEKARTARQSADEAKAAADREIEAAAQSVTPTEKKPDKNPGEKTVISSDPAISNTPSPKDTSSDASN
jgi:hypothetical protein